MTQPARTIVDSDILAVRRASRLVGVRIAVACTAVVLVVITAVFLYILSEITPAELFEPVPDAENLTVGAVALLRGVAILGAALIVFAGVMSWLVTRRAVQPLGEALRIQRAFVADASHELRTPLAVLDARLQILQRGLPDGDPSSGVVAELRRDAKSLIHIVNELLESAELGGASPTEAEASDVIAAAQRAVQTMSLLAAEKQIAITFTAPEQASSYVPPSGITRCAVALIDNALRFAPPHSTVSVEVAATPKTVSIVVRDHGPGIQGIDPARIFDRFAHSGSAVGGGGDTKAGFGIGLSLVRDIAVRYGGSIEVLDSSASGTAICLTVPRAKPY